MQALPGAGMTGGAIATTSRNTCLQSRDRGVAECTVIEVGGYHRTVNRHTGIVTIQTVGRATSDVASGNVIDTAVSDRLIRVTIQTVGRIDTRSDCVNDFLTRAAVTGGTGTRTVSEDVVLDTFDLGPTGNHVTAATGGAG